MSTAAPENEEVGLDHPSLLNRVIILNGFTNDEIVAIMRSVKALAKPGPEGEPAQIQVPPKDLIFAKTTPSSLQTVLKDLIADMSGDHEYLQKNPPQIQKKS